MDVMMKLLFVFAFFVLTSAQDEEESECMLQRTDLRGGDLYGINNVPTAEACKDICMSDWKCQAFTWATWKRCYIKTDKHKDPRTCNQCISGKAKCFKDDPRWQPSEMTNVALRENVVARSSGDRHGGKPNRAIDNSTVTYWEGTSCSYSNTHDNVGWWEVDLNKTYTIDHIMIYSRSDRDQNWLNGAKVLVGNQVCQELSNMEKNLMKGHKIDCGGRKLVGKKIRIEKHQQFIVLCEVQVMVENPDVAESPATPSPAELPGEKLGDHYNVAYKKKVKYSSIHGNIQGHVAVDGFTNQEMWRRSCFHSNRKGGVEFWEVDLARNYQIDMIKIFTRTDCCTNRDLGIKVYVGDNFCGVITKDHGRQAVAHEVKCEKELMAGSKVRIEKLLDYLQLCEVQVLVKSDEINEKPSVTVWPGERSGEFTNVAVGKKATQSSTAHNGEASRGTDGYDNGNWGAGTCTHTHHSSGIQYWEVDLGKVYDIDHIVINGRTDCCEDRLNGARVLLGKKTVGYLEWPRHYKKPMTFKNETGMQGRVVRIEKINNIVTVCEVKVMVKNDQLFEEVATTAERFQNVALKKPTWQSSERHGGVSSRVVDGYPDLTKWNEHSCAHSDHVEYSAWGVNLEKAYYIDRIIVYTRSDCCHDHSKYATVSVDGRVVGNLGSENGVKWTFDLGGFKGHNVTIQKRSGRRHPLMLCEVQVIVDNEFVPDESDVDPINSKTENIALKAKTSAMTSMFGGSANKINDGIVNGDFFGGSCYFSGPNQGPNMVTVAANGPVGSVSVYPRLDSYEKETIDGAWIRAGDKLCGQIEYVAGKMYYTVDCGQVQGPVSISKLGWLSICEVVVHSS